MLTTAQINLFVIDWNKWFLQKKISTSFFNKSILITLRKLQKKIMWDLHRLDCGIAKSLEKVGTKVFCDIGTEINGIEHWQKYKNSWIWKHA